MCNMYAAVANDTIYSDTPAVDSGVTTPTFFVGCDSMVCDVYGIKFNKQFYIFVNMVRHAKSWPHCQMQVVLFFAIKKKKLFCVICSYLLSVQYL